MSISTNQNVTFDPCGFYLGHVEICLMQCNVTWDSAVQYEAGNSAHKHACTK